MKAIFANKWVKRLFSIVSVLYTLGVCRICYYSIFYDIHIKSRSAVLLTASLVSLAALVIMLYSRKQILTRLASFIILPAMLPVVLLYFGEWEMIIPIIVTGVVILFLSGAGEGAKTAFGTIILLLYRKGDCHRERRVAFGKIPLQRRQHRGYLERQYGCVRRAELRRRRV